MPRYWGTGVEVAAHRQERILAVPTTVLTTDYIIMLFLGPLWRMSMSAVYISQSGGTMVFCSRSTVCNGGMEEGAAPTMS